MRLNVARDFSEAMDRLMRDYFWTAQKYAEELFERRLRGAFLAKSSSTDCSEPPSLSYSAVQFPGDS
eukprot:IDg5060t1